MEHLRSGHLLLISAIKMSSYLSGIISGKERILDEEEEIIHPHEGELLIFALWELMIHLKILFPSIDIREEIIELADNYNRIYHKSRDFMDVVSVRFKMYDANYNRNYFVGSRFDSLSGAACILIDYAETGSYYPYDYVDGRDSIFGVSDERKHSVALFHCAVASFCDRLYNIGFFIRIMKPREKL